MLNTTPSPVADVFVDQAAPNCSAGLGTALDPVCSIESAIFLAMPGDTIRIAPGTYVENVTVATDLDLVGTGGASVTILDGSSSDSVVVIPSAVTVTLDGLTITHGKANHGGGIRVEGNLTLRNSKVIANEAKGVSGIGGGIGSAAGGGSITIVNSTISGNTTMGYDGGGGGIGCVDGATSISILNSRITDNLSANNGYLSNGGGIHVRGGKLSIVDSTISGNECRSMNGYYESADGGGICIQYGALTLCSSTISNNKSVAHPGMSPGDHSGGYGGGISAFDTLLNLENSTISGNEAYGAGGIRIRRSTAGSRLSSMTIIENRAYSPFASAPNSRAGGMSNDGANPVTVHSSIIAKNSSTHSPIDTMGLWTSLGYNFIGAGGIGFIDGLLGDQAGTLADYIDPGLSELASHGGPTETHVPLSGSPVLNAGDPLNFPPLDQRGVSRPLGGRSEIGAVEFDDTESSLCNGDGGDQMGCTDCPCDNNSPVGTIGGCLNSTQRSARLWETGSASLSIAPRSTDDLRFAITFATTDSLCILTSGQAVAPQNPFNPCFGANSGGSFGGFDGLRCAVVNVNRHGARTSDSSGSVGQTNEPWGGEGGPPSGIAGGLRNLRSGQARYFQVIYREDERVGCGTGLSTTQAIEIVFLP